LAHNLQVPVRILACRVPELELRNRLAQRQGDIADATVDLIPSQRLAQQEFTAAEEPQVVLINTACSFTALEDLVKMLVGVKP